MHEDVSFIYKVECAAVERLKSVSFIGKYFPNPELQITFCLLETSSNDKHPA